MAAQQYTYTIPSNETPFSITPGGFANLGKEVCVAAEPVSRKTITQIEWVLRDRFTNEVFSARQDITTDHAALYAQIVCEKPLLANHVYETIKVSSSKALSSKLKPASEVSQTSENRLGFARGTHIMTSLGEVKVENLKAGDRVITRDHGLQEIRWIGSEKVTITDENAPILFRKGALKNARDLIVSPDHRVVLKGAEALVLYGVKEVLIPARKLVNGKDIVQGVSGKIEFFQILTDRHEVLYAEAAASESFMPDEECLENLSPENKESVFAAFPVLSVAPASYGPAARGFVEAESL